MKPNLLDKVITFFSPTAGARRMRSRFASEIIVEQARKFDAASQGRRTEGWRATGSDVNVENAVAGNTLRNRSRDLIRNNPFARKAAKVIPANVVGSGIRASIHHPTKKSADAIKEIWKGWSGKTVCDFDDRKTFYGIQRLVMRSVVESGEVFVRQIRSPKLAVPLQLQILESDFLDITKDGQLLNDGGYIEQGIEFNEAGKRVAYWMFKQHPGGNRIWKTLDSVRIPADQIIHIFYEERPGQLRGIPFGTASMLRLRDFDEYEDSQLIRQKIAACFSVFVTTTDETGPGDKNPLGGDALEKVEPGIIEYLPPGKTVSFGDPPTVENYDEYSRKILQGIAAGYDVTYEALTNDLSNVNFSSGRMGWIEFGKLVSEWQSEMLIPLLCEGVWKWFYNAITLTGKGAKTEPTVEWTAPRREFIDPAKEIKGLSDLVRNGFDSWQNVIRQLGLDPETVLKQIEADNKLFDGLGLMLVSDARHDPARKPDEPETPDDGDDPAPPKKAPVKKAKKA